MEIEAGNMGIVRAQQWIWQFQPNIVFPANAWWKAQSSDRYLNALCQENTGVIGLGGWPVAFVETRRNRRNSTGQVNKPKQFLFKSGVHLWWFIRTSNSDCYTVVVVNNKPSTLFNMCFGITEAWYDLLFAHQWQQNSLEVAVACWDVAGAFRPRLSMKAILSGFGQGQYHNMFAT